MKILSGSQRRRSEAGVALLIAIFVLLLIGVTAIALILSSGAESALAGNYRSSASTYYAALAGIEEARGRLLPSNPDYLGLSVALPAPFPLGQVIYIKNPLIPSEVINPTDLSNPSTYPDKNYPGEFAGTPYATPTTVQFANSVSPVAGIPGALYKWVRINAVTERSLKLDVDGNGSNNGTTPLYYDYACLDAPGKPGPGPNLCLNHSPNAVQALEVTALAALPNGSQKLLQYIVAPFLPPLNFTGSTSSNVSFPAALTLIGNNVSFTGPNSAPFQVNGNDQCGASSAVYGVGYTNGIDSKPNGGSYSGAGTYSPNIVNLSGVVPPIVPSNLQTPSGLDQLVQTIAQNADAVLTGPTDETKLPAGMSPSNPMTIVVNGDFDLGNHFTGSGVLVVTGTFSYDTDSSWKGLILVIGQGTVVSNNLGTTSGEIDGAILVAKTRDSSGNLLPALGSASFKSDPNGGGLGIYYSSCWLNTVAGPQKPMKYQVLSYHQLSQ
jgi:hypothetical protein